MKKIEQEINIGNHDPAFWGLYKFGAVAAWTAAVIFRRNLDAEWMLLRGMGIVDIGPATPPGNMAGWFMLLTQQPLLGLTLLNLFDLVNYALVGLILLALAVALRKNNPSGMLTAAALGAIGVTVFFASNQAFPLLSLSRQYANTPSETQRAMILAAAQAVLAIHQSSSYAGQGIYLSFLLVSAAGMMISITMLSSNHFSRGTALIGILANGFQLGYYIVLVFAPAFVAVPISISAIFLLIWYIQVGIRLWNLDQRRSGRMHSIPSIGAISTPDLF
jgi:hypothetical protein